MKREWLIWGLVVIVGGWLFFQIVTRAIDTRYSLVIPAVILLIVLADRLIARRKSRGSTERN